MRKELIKSRVVFNQAEHTYTLDGKTLSGITGMLERQLFPDKYSGVPQFFIRRAAAKGSFIHEVCELVDDLGIDHECGEAVRYKELKQRYGLTYEASEYLVSDNMMFASCIDKVFREGEDEFSLGDIKTTCRLDTEYVRWQLSIYAFLFELQNPECKVKRLLAIWLRGDKSQVVEVERIPSSTVIELLEAEAEGRKFANPIPLPAPAKAELPMRYREMEDELIDIEARYREYEKMFKDIKEMVMKEMVKSGEYQWSGERVTFIRRADSIRKTFDKEAFEKDYPGVYSKYLKDSPLVGSLVMKVKQVKQVKQ